MNLVFGLDLTILLFFYLIFLTLMKALFTHFENDLINVGHAEYITYQQHVKNAYEKSMCCFFHDNNASHNVA